jgi:hypothetical protein
VDAKFFAELTQIVKIPSLDNQQIMDPKISTTANQAKTNAN